MPFDIKAIKAVEKKALDILRRFEIVAPPVPVKEMAIALGLKVLPYDLGEDVSGILVVKNNAGTIGYNPSNSKVRQRFTIAHELGHYLLHNTSDNKVFIDKDFIVKYRSEKKYTKEEFQQEQEANCFAASLLMPKFLIQNELLDVGHKNLNETEFIEKLARTFNVSIPAMSFRSANLDLM